MGRTLYVTDLDGTLLNTRSEVSRESARIITDLSREGALITVATARTPATVEPLLADTLTTGPAVVMTGATLWNRATQSYLEPAFLNAGSVNAVRGAMERHGLCPFVYILPDDQIIRAYHPAPLTATDRDFVDKRSHLRLKQFVIGEEPAEPADNCIIVFAMGEPDAVFAAAEEIESDAANPTSVSAYVDPCSCGVGVLEVKAPGTSKAASVKRVAEMTGADRIVVFGDNINDLSMMETADIAVAVGNAVPQVMNAADRIIGTNDADSVARFIETDFRNNG